MFDYVYDIYLGHNASFVEIVVGSRAITVSRIRNQVPRLRAVKS